MDTSYLETLYEIARQLNSERDTTKIFETVVQHLPRVIDATYCSLFTMNPSSEELEIRAHNHPDIGDNPFISVGTDSESIMNIAIRRKTSLIIKDIEEEIGLPKKDKYATKSFMCILIRQNDTVRGVLNLADKTSGNFTREDMLFASILCELLGAFLGDAEPIM